MKLAQISALAAAVAVVSLASCTDGATELQNQLVDDSTVTADVVSNAGEAMGVAIDNMIGNELALALPGASPDAGASVAGAHGSDVDVTRSRTCYDADGAVVAGCSPLSSVRKVITAVTVTGSRSGSSSTEGGPTKTWSGAVHRNSTDTLTRNFNTAEPPAEVSRTHSDLTVGHDTTTFSAGDRSWLLAETVLDSIRGVTWNLPRSNNPWPVSGYIVRLDTVRVTATRGDRSESRQIVRTLRVDFPPDAQGNVVLTVNGKTCNLNLVTRVVSNCQ